MTVDFASLLTTDQKRQLLEGRIAQFASEAYQYDLNLKTAQALEAEEQVEQITESLKTLEAAIVVHQTQLAGLPVETAEPTPQAVETTYEPPTDVPPFEPAASVAE